MDRILNLMENGVYYGEYDNTIPYSVAYETAQLRENMLNWFPFEEKKRVAYICDGYGAIVPFLCRTFREVFVFINNKEKAEYIKERSSMYDNLVIIQDDIFLSKEIKNLDYILVDDYFYTVCNEIKMKQPEVCFLKHLKSMLNDNGEILLAIDNRLALAAFGGAFNNNTEDALFQQLDGTGSKRLFSKIELVEMMEESGMTEYKFYYCFPGFAWPRSIYTDESIAFMRYGHHYNNIGKDRYVLFDEFKLNYELQENGCVDVFANSFFIRISKNKLKDIKLIYAKNQYFIDKKHKICTSIFQDAKKRWVEKRGLTDEAEKYLEEFYNDTLKLSKYQQNCFKYVPYERMDNGVLVMPYVEGESISAVLEKKLEVVLADLSVEKSSRDDLYNEFKIIYSAMKASACLVSREELYSKEFIGYYGEARLKEEQLCLKPVALDLHVDHMYKKGDIYEIIDIDPIGFFWVPIEYLIYSLVESWYYAYIYRFEKAEALISIEDICEYLGIDWSNVSIYKLWKNKVFSNKKAISQIEPFYSKVYKPDFIHYEDINRYGKERYAGGRFQRAREESEENNKYKIEKTDRFILYGAAALGKVCLDILHGAGYSVIGFMDKRCDEINEAHGLPVWSMKNAEKAQDIIILISIKNVFEHQGIADNLFQQGYKKIIFLPQKCIKGEETNLQSIYDTYNYILSYKGKSSESLNLQKELPLLQQKPQLQLNNTGIIDRKDDYVVVNMPIVNLFTAQRRENFVYPWAEQSIISLIPHTALYNYLWGGVKLNKTQYYIDFCSYGAVGSGVEMTEGWKKNLISNRLVVLDEMKKSLETDYDFFNRNAPKAVWNQEKRYFNLNEGRHRAALFVYEKRYTMPVAIKAEEYEEFYNSAGVLRAQQYFNSLEAGVSLPVPISHPAFADLKCNRLQYYPFVMKTIMEFLSEFLLCKNGVVNFGDLSAGLLVNDCGELKRLLSKVGCKVWNLGEVTTNEKVIDQVFKFRSDEIFTKDADILIFDTVSLENEVVLEDIYEKNKKAQFIFYIMEVEKIEKSQEIYEKQGYRHKRLKSCFYGGKHAIFEVFYREQNEKYITTII